MIENNYKEAARLIAAAEEISKLPVRVVWDDTLQVGAVLHLSEADWTKQLRLSVNPSRKDIPYLVGSQCAVAIRFYKQHETKHLGSKAGSLEKTVQEFIDLGYSQKASEMYANNIEPGVGQQLRGLPTQIAISTWLYREYPELRESQLIFCLTEVEKSLPCLDFEDNKFPAWLLKNHQAMNGAFVLATDYLFERNDLFEPYKKKGLEAICTELLGDIINSKPDTSDTELVDLWLKRLPA